MKSNLQKHIANSTCRLNSKVPWCPAVEKTNVLFNGAFRQTQHLVNLVGNYFFKKFIFNFRINYILNKKMKRTQNTEIGDVTNEEYRLPTQFNLGVKFNF